MFAGVRLVSEALPGDVVQVEVHGPVKVLVINRPEALNAINEEVLLRLDEEASRVMEGDATVRAVVITGAGEKAFAAGADIKAMAGMKPMEALRFSRLGQRVFSRIASLPVPVIAAVNGYALGGGCELALACDMRIAAENAVFGQPEVRLGIIPGWGGTQRLARLVGVGIAKELILTGRRIDATTALRIGLVNAVHPAGELLEKALGLAAELAVGPPVALRFAKEAVDAAFEAGGAAGMEREATLFALLFNTSDSREGLIAFQEKRQPLFKGW